LARKAELEKEAKRIEELALEKERKRDQKIKTIGNYVHDSVPIHDNEVCDLSLHSLVAHY
jgi:seryl-tRNA synthetase